MYLYDECRFSPTCASNKNKMVPKEKNWSSLVKRSQIWLSPPLLKWSNKEMAMSIHHPHIFPPSTHHSQAFPIKFDCCPKNVHECSVLLHETKIHRTENYYFHILQTMHPFAKMFQGEMQITMHINKKTTHQQIRSIKKKKVVKKMYLSHEEYNNINSTTTCMSIQRPSGRYIYKIFLISSLEHIIVRNFLSMHKRWGFII